MKITINKADMTKHDGSNVLPLAGHEEIIVLHKNGLPSCGWMQEYVDANDVTSIDYYMVIDIEVIP